MKLENQVCTLDQAKRLKELGISQDSLFSWFGYETTRVMDNGKDAATVGGWIFVSSTEPVNEQQADHRGDTRTRKPIAATFTVAELGVMLPVRYTACKQYNGDPVWWCQHYDTELVEDMPTGKSVTAAVDYYAPHGDHVIGFHTEAEALAALLIHLLESAKVTAEEVNNRLNA